MAWDDRTGWLCPDTVFQGAATNGGAVRIPLFPRPPTKTRNAHSEIFNWDIFRQLPRWKVLHQNSPNKEAAQKVSGQSLRMTHLRSGSWRAFYTQKCHKGCELAANNFLGPRGGGAVGSHLAASPGTGAPGQESGDRTSRTGAGGQAPPRKVRGGASLFSLCDWDPPFGQQITVFTRFHKGF